MSKISRIALSDIVTAFNYRSIGTKVIDEQAFWETLSEAVEAFDWSTCRVPGQALIDLPEAIPFVSSGVGNPSDLASAYVLRSYRGKVSAYLRREYAAPMTHCSVVVYSKEAYLLDPDCDEAERVRIEGADPTHVLVAVLATSGEKSVLSPYRFVKNLAGGNNEALAWTAEEVRAKAREISEQLDRWDLVAD
jgi:hypothetical protein